jgi:hypothetical protein
MLHPKPGGTHGDIMNRRMWSIAAVLAFFVLVAAFAAFAVLAPVFPCPCTRESLSKYTCKRCDDTAFVTLLTKWRVTR